MASRYLIIAFSLLLATMLVGLRFDASWAGGSGFAKHGLAFVVGMNSRGVVQIDRLGKTRDAADKLAGRGEIVRIGEESHAVIELPNKTRVALDERTDIRLEDLRPGRETIKLLRGRIVAEGEVIVRTNYLDMKSSERTAFVNYDFEQKIGVAPIEGAVEIKHRHGESLSTDEPVEVMETEFDVAAVGFDPESSAAADFFDWAFAVLWVLPTP